jgi:hypothetical protein
MPAKPSVSIQPIGFEPAITRAALELERYLPKLAPVAAEARPALAAMPRDGESQVILGVANRLAGRGLGALPEPHDLDDALAIVPKGQRLYLAGSNPRSVLFAAYRLLEELGAVFLRPGPGGEVLPKQRVLTLPRRAIREKASYRHRGICIEGSPRLDHVLDVLDWMAKKKMNAFQLQFRHAGVFWQRGYGGVEMDQVPGQGELTETDCLALDDRVITRVRELGMLLHRVGHGWTAYAVGLPGLDWSDEGADRLREEQRSRLAEVNGKRALWHNQPINTELCYSQPQVREAFVEEVVSYTRRHPEVDFLHVWMSDAYNNKCECAECRRLSPTDWYVMLVNQIGWRLKQEELPTKVVFLGYLDMLWPPEQVSLSGDNLVFMYAPMNRCYRHGLDDPRCGEEPDLRRPALNRFVPPRGNRAFAALAELWKSANPPDSFIFDYHMWRAVWWDGLGEDVGRVMARDIKALRGLGLNGLVSCQCIRAFYPLPYLPNAIADMLWNSRLSPRRHRERIMVAAFGKHAGDVEDYFGKAIEAFRLGAGHDHRSLATHGGQAERRRLEEAASFAEAARARLAGLAGREREGVVRTSLELVALHAEQAARVAEARLARLDGRADVIEKMHRDYRARLPGILSRYGPWVDPMIGLPVLEALAE